MPFYTWLRPGARDSKATLRKKRRTAARLKQLRDALDAHIEGQPLGKEASKLPPSSGVLRLATWNLREFDSASYGSRMRESMSYIAEIINQFDLVALQEIRRDTGPLKALLRLLGPNWDYITTDVTEGGPGNKERMAFVYNRRKVWFRNVAGELTLPNGMHVTDPFGERFKVEGGADIKLPAGATLTSPTGLRTSTLKSGATKINQSVEIALADGTELRLPAGTVLRFAKNARVPLNRDGGIDLGNGRLRELPEDAEIVLPPNSLRGGGKQFARTPFIVSFQAGWLKLNIATVHILFGQGAAGLTQRTEEIERLTAALAKRAKSDSDSDADAYFVALGDFNIVDREHKTMQALTSNGFEIPAALQQVPGSNVAKDKFYDQIALWMGASKRHNSYSEIRTYRAGVFDFFDVVFRSDEESTYRPFMRKPGSEGSYSSYAQWRTHQMSDHLPMWVELHIDFSDEYLDEVVAGIDEQLV